ncbi:PEP-CTERM sorting domain-containing protein [Pseudoduganella umbonata]|uniref:PEP-CTERM sorting domain-containing protein n=1 Tax=Pseudoduganella umbonata TaxID=864828 RepID=A0A4P8HL30_9BURK|nr:PEP-CTERM sorting domain-containing protein [Pseudoduganella umbonata]MBB3221693.1 hypothetical protein [Pseudoduganella umbonata]QCP09084.1 PEP-CTERM sorting domain-containing protein [Pseudoduganella umbonata]
MAYLKAMLTAALIASTAHVHADSRAEVSYSGLRYTLIDLDVNDGITPNMHVHLAPNSGRLSLSTESENEGSNSYRAVGETTEPLAGALSTPIAHASGSITGRESAWTESFVGTVAIMGDRSTDRDELADLFASSTLVYLDLSPKTEVVFSFDARLALETNDLVGENVQANFWASLIFFPPEEGAIYAEDSLSGSLGAGGRQQTSLIRDEVLTVSFVNNRTVSVGGRFFYNASMSALNLSAVPEPDTYGMMLAGLGVVGLVNRRRKAA